MESKRQVNKLDLTNSLSSIQLLRQAGEHRRQLPGDAQIKVVSDSYDGSHSLSFANGGLVPCTRMHRNSSGIVIVSSKCEHSTQKSPNHSDADARTNDA